MTGAAVQVLGLVFGVTAIATMGILRASRRWRLVDVPNERSAHSQPTPTMGGVGIAVGIAAGVLITPIARDLRVGLLIVLAVLLLAIADNIGRPLSVSRKLLLQLVAAGSWIIWAPATSIQLTSDLSLGPGGLAMAATLVWLLWLMNVFNFMDGIDALTGSQAVAMCVGLALILPSDGPLGQLPILVIAACLGFLLFNAPPARIFMGDVGSLSLGFLVGVIVLAAASQGTPLWLAAMPLTPYFVDTTYTVVRRFQRGENVLHAHKEHLYQRLVQAGWSHLQVDAAAILVTGLFSGAAAFGVRDLIVPGMACATSGTVVLAVGLWWKERRPGV
jgi:UDP-N-acetylmuramyl pentapeptide phosphotransferase/UDP-N-acetylglucosamine-1-phosphate transferase